MSMKYNHNVNMSNLGPTLKCTDLPQFDALVAAAHQFRHDDKLHLRNLCNDSARCAGLVALHTASTTSRSSSSSSFSASSTAHTNIILDYSRQCVTGETMELLFDLADAVGLTDRREAFRQGQRINTTEHLPVLHHVLRMPKGFVWKNDGPGRDDVEQLQQQDVLNQVNEVQDEIQDFSKQVRSGQIRSITGRRFTTILVLASGACQLGPECVAHALEADPVAAQAAQGRQLVFLSNVDPVDLYTTTQDLNPAETLVVIVDKKFGSTAGTMLNARTVQNWLCESLNDYSEREIVEQHMVAVSETLQACKRFGIHRVFRVWDWVNRHGRFGGVTSAMGLLPLSLHYSYPIMQQFLDGAHDMDQHFFHAPLRDNIPVILGLLGVWNSTFLGYPCRAIMPYSHALAGMPAWLQHVDMESNGKRVALDGTPLLHASGQITFGHKCTMGQDAFAQLLHQGRVVPADFIGFMESQQPVDLPGEAVSNHDELMSNFFAQPDALAYGKTLMDLVQEGAPEPLREHMVFTGNRPSSSLLLTRLDAFSMGQLVALYEHRTVVQGFVWGINSFDQFGVELGKQLARHVRAQLSASRKTGASVQGFNTSTSTLLEHYLSHDK